MICGAIKREINKSESNFNATKNSAKCVKATGKALELE